jgi:hypothetical protein
VKAVGDSKAHGVYTGRGLNCVDFYQQFHSSKRFCNFACRVTKGESCRDDRTVTLRGKSASSYWFAANPARPWPHRRPGSRLKVGDKLPFLY